MIEVIDSMNYQDKLNNNDLVLMYFSADWCSPCKMISPIIEEFNEEFYEVEIYKIDIEKSSGITSDLKIKSIPTFILFKNGKEVFRQVGGKVKKEFFIDLIN